MSLPFVAIAGGETLLGRELRELIEDSPLHTEVRMVGEEEDTTAILTVQGDEPAVIAPLRMFADLDDAAAVMLAGSRKLARETVEFLRAEKSTVPVIDLTGEFENDPSARLRAPLLEGPENIADYTGIQVVINPAAAALALVLSRLSRNRKIARSVAQVFEPVSERGTDGIEELEKQTVSLLSLKDMPKKVFDEQVSFNLVARYGEQAPDKLETVQTRILNQVRQLVPKANFSVRLIQAPVFHAYMASLWVEFGADVSPDQVRKMLKGPNLELTEADEAPPTNISVAGQDTVHLGAIEADPGNPRAFWLWVAADNLRLFALSAIEVARPLLQKTATGRVQ